ncbi:hypothetical protein IMCC12053_451 [Celeribacter marinus]|uniref:Uncharacterized protein n=1 Tax=Celeribacter marinus TaxID=1397108 RepID=A0A0P0A2F3_9RHOB|nr:hypothetical protein IMCC12053_451 [Celeribacter marinus]
MGITTCHVCERESAANVAPREMSHDTPQTAHFQGAFAQ